MIEESKRIEYWNYLTAEKNQPRPRGITLQRLAVIKPEILRREDLWHEVIERPGAGDIAASEFYKTNGSASVRSRADFWEAVRSVILQEESKRNRQNKSLEPNGNEQRAKISRSTRQKRF